jgi:hypothetical protein
MTKEINPFSLSFFFSQNFAFLRRLLRLFDRLLHGHVGRVLPNAG